MKSSPKTQCNFWDAAINQNKNFKKTYINQRLRLNAAANLLGGSSKSPFTFSSYETCVCVKNVRELFAGALFFR